MRLIVFNEKGYQLLNDFYVLGVLRILFLNFVINLLGDIIIRLFYRLENTFKAVN